MASTDEGTASAQTSHLDEAQLRRWLSTLGRSDQLAGPEMTELLRAHGRLPENETPIDLGQAGAALLTDTIEKLRPPEEATRAKSLPYLVLKTCFIDGAKLFQAAARLGLSERQLSRERSRAIKLLKAELELRLAKAPRTVYRPEPIPTIRGFLARPGAHRKIERARETSRLINVHGPPGIGKTTLVAELAAEEAKTKPVMWYRLRPGVNDSLNAILFEVGDYLADRGTSELQSFLSQTMPEPDVALATRIAMKGLDGSAHLIVFDDYHLVEEDTHIGAFLDELVARLPQIEVVTIGRHRYIGVFSGESVEISSLARSETQTLLAKLGINCEPPMLRTLHGWTSGNPYLVKLAATWLRKATPDEVEKGVESLTDHEDVRSFLLSTVTELIDSDDRAILQGASVFRDRFNDDALAFVSGRTKGAVLDASLRLVRAYVATRNKTGDGAFFHNSVRQFVYERLEPSRKSELHARAAEWYERTGNETEMKHHRKLAAEPQ